MTLWGTPRTVHNDIRHSDIIRWRFSISPLTTVNTGRKQWLPYNNVYILWAAWSVFGPTKKSARDAGRRVQLGSWSGWLGGSSYDVCWLYRSPPPPFHTHQIPIPFAAGRLPPSRRRGRRSDRCRRHHSCSTPAHLPSASSPFSTYYSPLSPHPRHYSLGLGRSRLRESLLTTHLWNGRRTVRISCVPGLDRTIPATNNKLLK